MFIERGNRGRKIVGCSHGPNVPQVAIPLASMDGDEHRERAVSLWHREDARDHFSIARSVLHFGNDAIADRLRFARGSHCPWLVLHLLHLFAHSPTLRIIDLPVAIGVKTLKKRFVRGASARRSIL